MKIKVNWYRFFIGQMFLLTETHYFGWNFKPSCDAELICDGIVALITALAFTFVSKKGE